MKRDEEEIRLTCEEDEEALRVAQRIVARHRDEV